MRCITVEVRSIPHSNYLGSWLYHRRLVAMDREATKDGRDPLIDSRVGALTYPVAFENRVAFNPAKSVYRGLQFFFM